MNIHNGQLEVWTVGHSTRPIDELIETLKSFKIALLVDVRSYPGSRRYPQFNKANLADSLEAAGITYVHKPQLGGRRRARKDSTNIARRLKICWRLLVKIVLRSCARKPFGGVVTAP